MSDLIRAGSGVPTNSYFYRQVFAAEGFPSFYNNCLVGDYPMILYLGTCGRVHFMNRPMSAYRHNAAGSWTRSNAQAVKLKHDLSKIIDVNMDSLRFYYLGNKYETKIEHVGIEKGIHVDRPLIF